MVITGVGIITAINALVALSKGIMEVSGMIQKAQAEGRDLNVEELETIDKKYEDSFINLKEIIEKKKKEEEDNSG
jgi:hypothetical protein